MISKYCISSVWGISAAVVALGLIALATTPAKAQDPSIAPIGSAAARQQHVVRRQVDGQPVIVRSTGGVPAYATPMPTDDRVRILQAQYTEPADLRPQLERGARSGMQPIPESRVIYSQPAAASRPCPCSSNAYNASESYTPQSYYPSSRPTQTSTYSINPSTQYVPVVPKAAEVFRPLIPVTPAPANYYVGRGLVGQPTIYVPGQPVRNFLRYFSP